MDIRQLAKKTLNYVSAHSSLITLAGGLLPFILVLLMIYYFTRGNGGLTVYIINTVGVFEIWVTGLIASLSIIIQVLILFVLLLGWQRWNDLSTTQAIAYGIIASTAFIVVSIGAIIGFAVGIVGVELKKRKEAKNKKKLDYAQQSGLTRYVLLIGGLLVINMFLSYPNIPITRFELNDGSKLDTLVLKEQDDNYFALSDSDNNMIFVDKDNIKTINLCNQYNSILSKKPLNFFSKIQLIENC